MFDAPEHTRTLVSYLVEPGERVTAWLLRPIGLQPAAGWPAVVACHQHAGNFAWGKSEPAGLTPDPMFHYGLELCRRGYVVICPDHLCFEDRRTPPSLLANSPDLVDARYELYELTGRLLRGSCLQAKYLHDLRAAVDLLVGLPEVDASNVGTIGHSLGGRRRCGSPGSTGGSGRASRRADWPRCGTSSPPASITTRRSTSRASSRSATSRTSWPAWLHGRFCSPLASRTASSRSRGCAGLRIVGARPTTRRVRRAASRRSCSPVATRSPTPSGSMRTRSWTGI